MQKAAAVYRRMRQLYHRREGSFPYFADAFTKRGNDFARGSAINEINVLHALAAELLELLAGDFQAAYECFGWVGILFFDLVEQVFDGVEIGLVFG